VTSSALSRLLPFLVSLLFWRKKPRQSVSGETTPSSPETERRVNGSDASRSREILKVLTLEREIIGTALTTIYESEIQGIISRDERDRLLSKYSSDLKDLESRISEHQRIVDIFDLESAKKELLKSFSEKESEIDSKLAELRSGVKPRVAPVMPVTQARSDETVVPAEAATTNIESRHETTRAEPKDVEPKTERTVAEPQDVKAKTEKKIEAIREEVRKAMERLEQIESEG